MPFICCGWFLLLQGNSPFGVSYLYSTPVSKLTAKSKSVYSSTLGNYNV